MPVVLRLMRAGAKKRPFYRVVAADSRRQRDGRFIEIIGHYDPMRTPFELVIEKDRVQEWLSNGATPSTQVASLLRKAGMTLGKQSKPAKAAASEPAKGAPRKRTVKKTVSARKAKKKAARKAGKGAKPKTKKPKKK